MAIDYGADAIGLNFYQRSLRSVVVAKAKEIAAEIDTAKIVGVFVNEEVDNINEIVESVGLDFVQLHGDEPAEFVTSVQSDVIKVIRIMDQNFEAVHQTANHWKSAGAKAILLDAGSAAAYGGTGKQLDWEAMAALRLELPLILAGGLDCDNVAQAIKIASPDGIDVASGIEKFPGAKDAAKMRNFIEKAAKAISAADNNRS